MSIIARASSKLPGRSAMRPRNCSNNSWTPRKTSAPIYKELLVGALNFRAELATAMRQSKPAIDDLNKALAMTRALLDKHENQPDHIGLRGKTYLLLGRLNVAEKKQPDAEKSFDLAV